MSAPASVQAAAAALTDGAQVAAPTAKKLLKDFIADFLIGGATGIGATMVTGLQDAVAQPLIVTFALGNAAIAAAYRAVLRWATSD